MSDNPYNIPDAKIHESRTYYDNDVNTKIIRRMNRIKNVGILISVLTILGVVLAIIILQSITALYSLVDVILVAGLTFGIAKRSRVCSTVFSVYYIGSQLYKVLTTNKIVGLIIPAILVFFLIDGTIAIFEYHKAVKKINEVNTSTSLSP